METFHAVYGGLCLFCHLLLEINHLVKHLWIYENLVSTLTSFTEVLTTKKDGSLSNKSHLTHSEEFQRSPNAVSGSRMGMAFRKDRAQPEELGTHAAFDFPYFSSSLFKTELVFIPSVVVQVATVIILSALNHISFSQQSSPQS